MSLRILAHRPNTRKYLIATGVEDGDTGFIADLDQGQRWPEISVQSIISRGVWEPVQMDGEPVFDRLLSRLSNLPETTTSTGS